MKPVLMGLVAACFPAALWAQDITATEAVVPLAPPGVMTHAAYLTLHNTGQGSRTLIGVQAAGYAMAHLHSSEDKNGVATMSVLHGLEIGAGQTVTLEQGGMHIMLMHPAAPLSEGAEVALTLQFANGETVEVTAPVKRLGYGS
jgi:copper(I)-binding protein